MNPTLLRASIAILAIVAGASSQAHSSGDADHRLMAVPHSASAGEPGHGWRYFCDGERKRAVVISPQGDYFLSRGKGLQPVVLHRPGAADAGSSAQPAAPTR